MPFKFEKLEVWQLALQYSDVIDEIARSLPPHKEHNLKSQIVRAATSVALNIAEGSIGQTDMEQARFLGMAIRSLVETVACQHLISRRGYFEDRTLLRQAYRDAETLVAKLHALRRAIVPELKWIREQQSTYGDELSLYDA